MSSTHPTSIARPDLLPKLRKLRVHESEVVLTVGGLPAAQALVVHFSAGEAATLQIGHYWSLLDFCLKVTWKRRSMFLPVGQSEARLAGLAQEASSSPRFESAIVFLTNF